MVKISSFMIGMVIVSLIVVVLGLFMARVNAEYSPLGYDNESIEIYNQLESISNQTQQIQTEAGEIKEQSGVLDIIGGFFSDAYRVLLMTKTSYDTFDDMSNKAIDHANLGPAGVYFKIALSSIVLILIFIGVIISAVIKRDL